MARPHGGFNVDEFVSDSLKHYGVKGMRWGVRKRGDRVPAIERRPKSDDFKEAQALRKKRPAELSNAELKKLNERMQLEQNYANLTSKKNQQTIKEGREQVKMIMDLVKTGQVVYNMSKPAVKAAAEALKNR